MLTGVSRATRKHGDRLRYVARVGRWLTMVPREKGWMSVGRIAMMGLVAAG